MVGLELLINNSLYYTLAVFIGDSGPSQEDRMHVVNIQYTSGGTSCTCTPVSILKHA